MKRRRNGPNLIILFLLTTSIVVIVGVVGLFVMQGKGNAGGRAGVKKASAESDADGTGRASDNAADSGPVRYAEAIPERIPDAGQDASGLYSASDAKAQGNSSEADASTADALTADGEGSDLLNDRYAGVVSRFGDDLDDPEYLRANNIHVIESRDGDEGNVTLTFAGDILFDDEYAVYSKLLANGGAINAGIDQQVINYMKSSDVMLLNNEFPYTNRGTPTPDKTYTFRADTSTAHLITDMGVNVVGLANNHAYDFGREGFLDTLDTLDEAGIPYIGGGRNINEASAPIYFVVDGVKVGIVAATQIERLDNPDTKGATDTEPGVFRCLNPGRMLGVIGEMKEKCDFVVAFVHWGTESTTEVDWLQTDQAPRIAGAGADLIIGAHPHVLQPIGTSGGVPVFYSLGNFWFNSKELDTCLVRATVNTEGLVSLRFVPCRQVGCKTYMATGDEKTRILNDVRAMSPGVNVDAEGYVTY